MTRVRGLAYPLLCCPLPHSALLHPSSFGQIFQICRCSIPVSNFSTFYSLSLGWLVVSLAQGTLALLPPDLGILALSNFPAASSRLPGLPCPSNFFFSLLGWLGGLLINQGFPLLVPRLWDILVPSPFYFSASFWLAGGYFL